MLLKIEFGSTETDEKFEAVVVGVDKVDVEVDVEIKEEVVCEGVEKVL